jgi:hypothetical protein
VTTDAAWSLPSLRTDSVNRGLCISLFTLEIVVLASAFRFFLFFMVILIPFVCGVYSQGRITPFRQKMSRSGICRATSGEQPPFSWQPTSPVKWRCDERFLRWS